MNQLFPKELVEMLETRKVRGRTKDLPLMGASTENNLHVLAKLICNLKPTDTLEIGLATATSALVIAHGHRLNEDGAIRSHTAVDPYQHELDDVGIVQIERAGLERYFSLIRNQSLVALPELLANGRQFDLIYIDGNHLFEHAFIDMFYSMRLLRTGGVVLLDDSTIPDVKKIVNFIRRNFKGKIDELDLTSWRKPEASGLRYKVAKRLKRVQLTGFIKRNDPERPFDASLVDF
jgi:predicted O-methyltransferase YrrM